MTFINKTTSKRKRLKTNRFCDMNLNSIEKNNKLEKKQITVIDCFSDESILSPKSDIDKVANIYSKKDELNISKKRVNVNDRNN